MLCILFFWPMRRKIQRERKRDRDTWKYFGEMRRLLLCSFSFHSKLCQFSIGCWSKGSIILSCYCLDFSLTDETISLSVYDKRLVYFTTQYNSQNWKKNTFQSKISYFVVFYLVIDNLNGTVREYAVSETLIA